MVGYLVPVRNEARGYRIKFHTGHSDVFILNSQTARAGLIVAQKNRPRSWSSMLTSSRLSNKSRAQNLATKLVQGLSGGLSPFGSAEPLTGFLRTLGLASATPGSQERFIFHNEALAEDFLVLIESFTAFLYLNPKYVSDSGSLIQHIEINGIGVEVSGPKIDEYLFDSKRTQAKGNNHGMDLLHVLRIPIGPNKFVTYQERIAPCRHLTRAEMDYARDPFIRYLCSISNSLYLCKRKFYQTHFAYTFCVPTILSEMQKESYIIVCWSQRFKESAGILTEAVAEGSTVEKYPIELLSAYRKEFPGPDYVRWMEVRRD